MVLCQPNIQITRTTSFRRVSNAKPPLYHGCVPKEVVFVSTTTVSNENSKPNASGLTPDQTRALPERSVDPNSPEARIVRSLRELYSCKAQNVRLRLRHHRRPTFYNSATKVWAFSCRDHMKFILETLFFSTLLASPAG
jgi:hypothetical protein